LVEEFVLTHPKHFCEALGLLLVYCLLKFYETSIKYSSLISAVSNPPRWSRCLQW